MALELLLSNIQPHGAPQPDATKCTWRSSEAGHTSAPHYVNHDERLGIHFEVTKLPFSVLDVMDPRLVIIAPGSCNEKHRHAHESIFVVISGEGEIQIGEQTTPLKPGSVACVPRWVVHQSRNQSEADPLTLLAITDFGLTSAVLGDYDSKTRLKNGGPDAFATDMP